MIQIDNIEESDIVILKLALTKRGNKITPDGTGYNYHITGNSTGAFASYRKQDKTLFLSVVNQPYSIPDEAIKKMILMELGRPWMI